MVNMLYGGVCVVVWGMSGNHAVWWCVGCVWCGGCLVTMLCGGVCVWWCGGCLVTVLCDGVVDIW